MAKKLWTAREAARHLVVSHRLVNKLGLTDDSFPSPEKTENGVSFYSEAEIRAWGKARDQAREDAAKAADKARREGR